MELVLAMIEREEACLRSGGTRLAAGRPPWMVEVSILEIGGTFIDRYRGSFSRSV